MAEQVLPARLRKFHALTEQSSVPRVALDCYLNRLAREEVIRTSVVVQMNGMTTFVEPATKQERRERRVKLERDRDVVRAQLTELRQRLPGLQKSPSLGPSKQGGVSKKRPAANLADLPEDVKRQKVETERIRRVNSIWQQCQTIVKTLLKSVGRQSLHI